MPTMEDPGERGTQQERRADAFVNGAANLVDRYASTVSSRLPDYLAKQDAYATAAAQQADQLQLWAKRVRKAVQESSIWARIPGLLETSDIFRRGVDELRDVATRAGIGLGLALGLLVLVLAAAR